MNKLPPLALHVAVLLCVAFASAYASASVAGGGEPQLERQRELVRLVRQDCGSCHGLSLAGGLGPALLPAAVAGKPVELLVGTIMDGRPGTAMPGWSRFVSVPEAEWVVRQLIAGFPQDGGGQ